jgi:glycosyltransferase involved in cell wall biosynthesis
MSDFKPTLTVSIPSYNRASVVKTVAALVPQLTAEVCIQIVDNASETPVVELLKDYLSEQITVVRNSTNVGMSGNITKCFEHCRTEWMWLMSDDDIPASDAIETILGTLARHSDVCYIKYTTVNIGSAEYDVKEEVTAVGQRGLIQELNNFCQLIFMSSGVYNVPQIRQASKAAYYFAPTFAPHAVIVLAYLAMNPTAKVLLSPVSIVAWGPISEWGYELINKSLSDMVYTIQGVEERKLFYKKLNDCHPFRGSHRTNRTVRAAKLFRLIVMAKAQGKEHDMIADYFSSRSFMYWAQNTSSSKFLLKSTFVAIGIYFLNLPLIRTIANQGLRISTNVALKGHPDKDKLSIIYNRFSFFNKDFRL